MEAAIAPVAPAQPDFRAELHHLIDQIQDEAVWRAALLLLLPFSVAKEVETSGNPIS